MKLHSAMLICTALCMPVKAEAAPVYAFFTALAGVGGPAATAAALAGVFGGAAQLGAFLGGTLVGNILLNIAVNAAVSSIGRSGAPSVSDARVNFRLENATRWQAAGIAALGGSKGTFCERDSEGNLWYFVAHADAELTGEPQYLLDDIPVELSDGLDGFTAGDVITDDFCFTARWAQYEGTGPQYPVFRLFTVTPDASNVYGALPAEFTAAFPGLPVDFYLAGVCYTIVRARAIPPAHYGQVMRWSGDLRLGEPSVVLVGNWNRMYDPRNPAHDIDDRMTWTESDGNPAIVAAWFRTAPYGRNRPMSEIAWDRVAEQADICDLTVLNRDGASVPLYRCGLAWPDNKPREECEAEILATMDALRCYDDEGKWYPLAGWYQAPTLTFTAARDIMTAQIEFTDANETPVDGVVVYYTEPRLNYTRQPAAPWQNPDWYDGVSAPNYLGVEILGCHDHNQAVRLAKAIGQRNAATRRAAFTTTIKGVLATNQRAVNLDYDAEFQGVYEIISPVEMDAQGMGCAFAVVPLATDRWTLNAGEEGEPPDDTPDLGLTDTIPAPTGVLLTSDGAQIKATFTAPSRDDVEFEFRYRVSGSGSAYQFFAVNMDDLEGHSEVVTNGATYEVDSRTTKGARVTLWQSEGTILTQSNPTAPVALTAAGATGGTGTARVTFTTANDPNQFAVAVWRNTVNTFGTATLIGTQYAGPNVSSYADNNSLAAGSYYFWAVPLNNSGIAGPTSGSFSVTVT